MNQNNYENKVRYAERFVDLGTVYQKQVINGDNTYLFLFSVLKDDLNSSMELVYAEDKIETLSILTADVMTKLVKIKKRFGDNLEIVFFADKVYFRIDYSNLFEAKLNSEDLSIESIEKYYNLLCNIKDMSEYIGEVLKNANI